MANEQVRSTEEQIEALRQENQALRAEIARREQAGLPGGSRDVPERGDGRDSDPNLPPPLPHRQELFRTFARATFEGIAISEGGVLLEANEQFARMHGYTVPETIGLPITRFLIPQDHERLLTAVRSSQEIISEFQAVRKDGTTFPVEAHGRPVLWEGRPVRVTVMRDITAQKQWAASREAHLGRLHRLFEVSRQVLAEPTLDGLLARVVDAACELTEANVGITGQGYRDGTFRAAAFRGGDPGSFGPPDGVFRMERGGVYLEPIETGRTLRLSSEELKAHPRWWGLPPGHAPLNGLLAAPLIGRDGQISGLIMLTDRREGEFTAEDEGLLGQLAALLSAAMHHVEAREAAEEAAVRAEQLAAESRAGRAFLEELFDALVEGVVVYDPEGQPVRANPTAVAAYGLDPVSTPLPVLQQKLSIRHPDGLPVIAEELPSRRAKRGERVRGERYLFRNAEGHDLAILASAVPLPGQQGVVAVWHDVTERELLLSEAQRQRAFLEQLMAVAPVGIAVLRGPDHRFEYVNQCFTRLSKTSATPVVGRPVAEIFPGAGASGTLSILDEVFRTGRPARQREFQTPNIPGGPTYWTYDAVPLLGGDGQVDGILVVGQDVTEQVKARQQVEELAAQAQRHATELDAVFSAMPHSMVLFEPDGRIRRSNQAGKALFRLTPEYERVSMDRRMALREYMWPDGRPVSLDETPVGRALLGETVHNETMMMRRTAGEPAIWLSVSAAPLCGPQGEIVGAVSTSTDITELRAVQARLQLQAAELRQAEERYQAFIAHSSEAIWRVEFEEFVPTDQSVEEQIKRFYEHGYVAECNEAMARLHGLETADEVRGRRLGQLLPRLSAANVDLLRSFILGGYHVANAESAELDAQGEVCYFLTNLVGIVDPDVGALVRLWGVKRDITDLKQAEEALRERARDAAAGDERQRLARDLHDAVSQTLFSASLTADVLPRLYERDPVRGQELLAELRRMNRGALAEMRTLLLELRPQALLESDLATLLRQLAEAAASRSPAQVEVSAEAVCGLPPDVQVALYRIAQEALHNVAKHSRADHAAVRLHCTGQRVELSVEDDGCGFDLSKASANQFGLSIMAERAHSIGATLEIDTEPGRGTRVRATWEDS